MAAASDHVLVQVRIDSLGLARAGFGVPLILSHNAGFVERVRYYSGIAAVGDDFDDTSSEYRAANAMFAQTPHPQFVAIGRAAGSVTQRYDLGVVAVRVGQEYAVTVAGEGVTTTTVSYTPAADIVFTAANTGDIMTSVAHGMETGAGPYRLSNSGGALPTGLAADTNYWVIKLTADTYQYAASLADALAETEVTISSDGTGTQTLRRAQNDVICAQLVQGLNAVVGANYAATQVTGTGETDTVRVTASAAGNWFSLEINTVSALSIAQTHAAPSGITLADDLSAILLADQGWYCLVTLYNSAAYLLAAAAWTESNGRITVFDTVDSACITTALSGATDIGAQMLALGYTRTMGCYHHAPAEFLAAAIMGRWLCTQPGRAITKYKTLAGISPSRLTDTNKVNLRGIPGTAAKGRRMNAYEQVLADRPFFWNSTVFSSVNKYIDITRNGDWLADETQKAHLGVFVGNDIVPFTPEGIVMQEGALIGVAGLAVTQGVLAGTPEPVVFAPTIEQITSTDKGARNLRGLALSGVFAGAIEEIIPVTVVLTH